MTLNEVSLPGRADGSSLHYTTWGKRNPFLYIQGNTVKWSCSFEFPPGTAMTPEMVKSAKARGYMIMLIESTTTDDVSTVVPVSAAKVVKRSPPKYLMLTEVNLDRLNLEQVENFSNLCETALTYLDKEFAEMLVDREFVRFVKIDEAELVYETKLNNRTPAAKKIQAAKRYRDRRQAILRKKKEADQKVSLAIAAAKMAYSKKTRTGREKKKNHTSGHINEYYFPSLYEYLNEVQMNEAECEAYASLMSKHTRFKKLSEYLRG